MNPSNHGYRPLARLALAAGGIAAFIGVAVTAWTAARLGGTLAGVLVIGGVMGGCGLAHSLHSRREPSLTRPAPVRLPEPARDTPEPASSLS